MELFIGKLITLHH